MLLSILSQGSDPNSVQNDLEKIFDAISRVQFSKTDRKSIIAIIGVMGKDEEVVQLTDPVKAEGNIEDWLKSLEYEMCKSVKDVASRGSRDCHSKELKIFQDDYPAQIALMGI